jgi:ABC-type transport system involved in multi-copper enzyme maturation permease subunit
VNPIVRRELLDLLRTRKAAAAMIALAVGCGALVLLRWPSGGVSDLTGARSLQVLRVFGYGLLAGVLFLGPAVPATSVVRERVKGTLALLLNSPLTPTRIYLGKLGGALGFAAILLSMTLPAAAACYALGGASSSGGVGWLYAVLGLAVVQITTLGLFVSARAQSTDSALRATYGLVLTLVAGPLAPLWLVQGDSGPVADAALWLQGLSPVPAVMEVLGHAGVGTHGFGATAGAVERYATVSLALSLLLALATVVRLTRAPLDRSRPPGVMTEDRSTSGRLLRRVVFLVDPQRRSGAMTLWVNPVMVKEFRSRRFGRGHWTLRLIAVSALLSLGLSYLAVSGALDWGHQVIGGALVLLQTALVILFVPSLASGLISAEREGGGWQLLRMTPLSSGRILRGKLMSVIWPLFLLMCATLPGYIVLMTIEPDLIPQVRRVLTCLAFTAGFAVLLSAAASSVFPTTAGATAAANLGMIGVCVVPLLAWIGKDAPFGQVAVEAILTVSPVAGALHASATPGFVDYQLLPANWWVIGTASVGLLIVLIARTRHLYRPD